MVQSLIHFRWDTGFVEFCTALGLKQDCYAEGTFTDRFQSCIDQMRCFNLAEWAALVEAAEMTSNPTAKN